MVFGAVDLSCGAELPESFGLVAVVAHNGGVMDASRCATGTLVRAGRSLNTRSPAAVVPPDGDDGGGTARRHVLRGRIIRRLLASYRRAIGEHAMAR